MFAVEDLAALPISSMPAAAFSASEANWPILLRQRPCLSCHKSPTDFAALSALLATPSRAALACAAPVFNPDTSNSALNTGIITPYKRRKIYVRVHNFGGFCDMRRHCYRDS